MKRTVVALLIVAVMAESAFAASTIINMKRGVKFNHKLHTQVVKDCTKCHATKSGGKIEGFDKNWAHKNCKGCHLERKKGPTICKDCHKGV